MGKKKAKVKDSNKRERSDNGMFEDIDVYEDIENLEEYFVDISEAESSGTSLGVVHYKPVFSCAALAVVGGALIFFPSIWIRVTGIALAVLAAFAWFVTPERSVLEVFGDRVRIFYKENPSKVLDIPLGLISEWNVNLMGSQTIYVVLRNKSTFLIECYQTARASDLLNKVVGNKQSSRQRRERNRIRNASRWQGLLEKIGIADK